MSISKIVVYLLALVTLVFQGFFGIIPFLRFFLEVLIIAVGIWLLVTILRRSVRHTWKQTLRVYIVMILSTFGFFTSLFLGFISYQNMTPGVVSDLYLSYSGQSVVFVEMSHIATDSFYDQKKQTIEKLAQNGYTILVEGVKPGTKANTELFDRSMGFTFTPTLYGQIASLISLHSQDNAYLFEGINTGSLVSVDLSIDDIMALMGTGNMVGTGELLNIETEFINLQKMITNQERIFAAWVAIGLLNWSLKQSNDIDVLMSTGPQAKLFATIIDRRNDTIVQYIESHPKQKIAIVYGALHFNGVYEALQKKHPWNIVQVKTTTPYTK